MLKKNTTWIMIILFMFSIMLMACEVKTTNIVVVKSITTYLNIYIKSLPDDKNKQLIIDNKEALLVKAVHHYFYEIELLDLDQTDRIKQSILLAIAQLK